MNDDTDNLAAGDSRRRLRWERRYTAQRLWDFRARSAGSHDVPGKRCAGCGRWAFDDYVDIRGTLTDDGLNAYPVGTQTCGSVWACPVCSAKILTRRQLEVSLGAQRFVDGGGTLVMVTLTMRHRKGHTLAELMDTLKASKQALARTSVWHRKVNPSLLGHITTTEVTFGLRNGWHPHLHLLLFVRPGQDAMVRDTLAEWLPHYWRATVAERLGVAPSLGHGVHVTALRSDAAKYVAKIAAEVARGDLKADGRSPWQLLDGVDVGEVASINAWAEYVTATKGRRCIVWSRGLKGALIPDVEDITDEEAATEDVNGALLDVLPRQEWKRLASTRIAGTVLAVLVLEDYEAAGMPAAPVLHPALSDRGVDWLPGPGVKKD